MSSPTGFAIGQADGEQVRVQVISRAYPGGLDIFDDNWLNVQVHARVSPRSFRFGAFLRARSFAVFAQELQGLAVGECDCARFESRDPWIWIELRRCRGDAGVAGGAFEGSAAMRDGGSERAASIAWLLEAADLDRLREEISAVVEAFGEIPGSER